MSQGEQRKTMTVTAAAPEDAPPKDDVLAAADSFSGKTFVNRATFNTEVIRHRGDHTPAMTGWLKFKRLLRSEEDVYQRRDVKIERSQLLDTQWASPTAFVVITNQTRWKEGVIASVEEKAHLAACVLLIGPPECPGWLELHPGESLILPTGGEVMLTPTGGIIEIDVFAVPA